MQNILTVYVAQSYTTAANRGAKCHSLDGVKYQGAICTQDYSTYKDLIR